MPRIYGSVGTIGGTSAVPVPTAPVAHRGRERRTERAFVLHSAKEFTAKQVHDAFKPKRTPRPKSATKPAAGPGSRNEPLTQAEVAGVVAQYVAGATVREITAATGISGTTVIKYLHGAEVEIRKAAPRRGPKQKPGPKVCTAPGCGKEFSMREGERLDGYKRRTTCDRSCAAQVMVARRGHMADLPRKVCAAEECGKPFGIREGERRDAYKNRQTCTPECGHAYSAARRRRVA